MRERLGKELLFLDGGMGTLLQERGLQPGELPETWNIRKPEEIIEIHRQYYEAGSDIVLANTFGANAQKFHDDTWPLKDVIFAAVENAKKARILAGKDDGPESFWSRWETCHLTQPARRLPRPRDWEPRPAPI